MTRHQSLRRFAQRGAALLLAMVIVALVATLSAGMVWQQWRSIQVETAERSRAQSSWILTGALDWSRLILREDVRSSRTDHLGEPWATPLAEARLSTFLAADRDNNADSGPEAFLSGAIADAQARYNLRNLVGDDGKIVPLESQVLKRLCDSARLPADVAGRLEQALAASWKPAGADGAAASAQRPLAVQRFDHLAWLGFDAATLEALRPLADVLPERTAVNLNTAAREVLAAVMGIDAGTAERLLQVRQRAPFESIDNAKPHLPQGTAALDPKRVSVGSRFFHVSGRLRLEERVLEERSLVFRTNDTSAAEVVTIHRERRSQHTGAG